MYLFFAESASDPKIQKINEMGKFINDRSDYLLLFFIFCLLLFVLGIFLFHNSFIILFGSKIIKPISKKFSGHLLDLSEALRRKGDFAEKKWVEKDSDGRYTNRRIFEGWMQKVFTKEYSNNVTALAYFGASFLILIIGLRGIRIFITDQTPMLVIFGILLEVSMLILLAFTQFYTPEYTEEEEGPVKPILDTLVKEVNRLKGTLGIIEKELDDAKRLVRDAQDSLENNTDQDIWTISKRS
jgi:hypothetical protein